jgi:hypothetical protein
MEKTTDGQLTTGLLDFISIFRPLLRAEVFDSFTYLLCGLLIGEASFLNGLTGQDLSFVEVLNSHEKAGA